MEIGRAASAQGICLAAGDAVQTGTCSFWIDAGQILAGKAVVALERRDRGRRHRECFCSAQVRASMGLTTGPGRCLVSKGVSCPPATTRPAPPPRAAIAASSAGTLDAIFPGPRPQHPAHALPHSNSIDNLLLAQAFLGGGARWLTSGTVRRSRRLTRSWRMCPGS